jgi:hypothetical protein
MLGILILFYNDTILKSVKNVLMLFEPKLLVVFERIGEVL